MERYMNILLIDDDKTSLDVLQDVLMLNDFDCESYSDPYEALNSFKEKEFDAVLSDYLMPRLNGIELLKELKKINSKAKVLLYSACEDENIYHEAIRHGAHAYLTKPISWTDMERVLKEMKD